VQLPGMSPSLTCCHTLPSAQPMPRVRAGTASRPLQGAAHEGCMLQAAPLPPASARQVPAQHDMKPTWLPQAAVPQLPVPGAPSPSAHCHHSRKCHRHHARTLSLHHARMYPWAQSASCTAWQVHTPTAPWNSKLIGASACWSCRSARAGVCRHGCSSSTCAIRLAWSITLAIDEQGGFHSFQGPCGGPEFGHGRTAVEIGTQV